MLYKAAASADIWSLGVMMLSLVLDTPLYEIEQKIPDYMGVQGWTEMLQDAGGTWMGHFHSGDRVSLKPQFQCAEKDIHGLLDMILQPIRKKRPTIGKVLAAMKTLIEKHIRLKCSKKRTRSEMEQHSSSD